MELHGPPGDEQALNVHLEDAEDAHAASAIGFTPAGTIAATDVQAAIEELATETQADLDAVEATIPTTAADVPIVDAAADFAATDVEGALAELQADAEADAAALSAHIGDPSGAHGASAIEFTPAGTIAATDVQAAIEEVALEAGSGSVNADDVNLIVHMEVFA